MDPILSYTLFANQVNYLVDEGATLPIDEVQSHIADRTLFSWLQTRFADFYFMRPLRDDEQGALLEFFESLIGYDVKVENNGLCLLVGYCIEAIQQIRPGGRRWMS